MVICKIGM